MIELLAGPWGPLLIFGLRIVDVSMATVRVMALVRGARWIAPLIGFFEILIWILAIGAAIQNLNSAWHVVGYAGGFAAGTAVGIWVEGRLAFGWGVVRTISRSVEGLLAGVLREAGFAVTEMKGEGKTGPVTMLYTVVRRRQIPQVLRTIDACDPQAFVMVQSDAAVRRGSYAAARKR